jgi:hypothetical protein
MYLIPLKNSANCFRQFADGVKSKTPMRKKWRDEKWYKHHPPRPERTQPLEAQQRHHHQQQQHQPHQRFKQQLRQRRLDTKVALK